MSTSARAGTRMSERVVLQPRPMGRVVPEEDRQRYLLSTVTIEIDGVPVGAARAVDTLGTAVFIVTATDPGEIRDGMVENRRRNRQLRAQLIELGAVVHPALGISAEGADSEEMWAATDIGETEARALGRQWGQDAVMELTSTEVRVVGCFTRWVRSRPITNEPTA